MSKRYTEEDIRKEIFDTVGDEYSMVGEYKNKSTKVLMKHNTCGNEWEVSMENFFGNKSKKGTRCPKCSKVNAWNKRDDKLNFENVRNNIENKFKEKLTILNIYRNESDGGTVWVTMKCNIHKSEIWDARYANILRQKHGCSVCSNIKQKTIEEKISIIENQNYNIVSHSKNHKNFYVSCKVDGHKRMVKWKSFRDGVIKCPVCLKDKKSPRRLNIEEVREKLHEINKNIIILSDHYITAHEKLKCKCLICNNEWDVTWANLSNKRGCPKCGRKNSHGNGGYNPKRAIRNKEEWIKKKCKVYIVRLYNEDESFFKIGISSNIKGRFSSIPYNMEIIKTFESNLYDCVFIEKILHEEFEYLEYSPIVNFKGWTECFSEIDLNKIEQIIREYED